MPDPQYFGAPPPARPVSVGRKPKKKTAEPPHPDVPAGSGLDAPAPLPPRTQALNAQFGGMPPAQAAVASPPEFTADLPDPSVVGLNTGAGASAAQRRPVNIPPPVAPAAVQTNTPGVMLQPDLGVAGPPPPMPEQAVDPHAGESATDRMVREAAERLQSANQEQPQKRKGVGGRILSGLESFVIEGGRPFRSQMPHNAQELAYGLSRGAAGGVYGAVNTEYPSRVRIESKRQLAGQQYDEAVKRQTAETQNRLHDAQAEYASGRGPREDLKLGLQGQYNRWRMSNGDARLSETENYHRFLLAERQAGRLSQEEYHRSLLEDLDLDRTQRGQIEQGRLSQRERELTERERHNRVTEKVAAARAMAYQRATERGGNSSEVKKETAAAEAEVYDDAAAEIEGDLYELGRTPEDERGSDYSRNKTSLERQLRDNRIKAEKARAVAGQQTDASRTSAALVAITDEAEVRRLAREANPPRDENAAVAKWKRLRARNR